MMRKLAALSLMMVCCLYASAAGLDYPEYSDRAGWTEFFGDRASWYIAQGEKYLDYRYEYVPASVYLAFETGGDRSSFGADYRARKALVASVMAELAEGRGRFMRTIIDGVWYFSEKISWVHPQHAKRKSTGRSLGDPDEEIIGITSSFIGMDVAYAWHFFHEAWDEVDPSISRAVLKAMDTHIFNPFLDVSRTDANWWLGFTPGMPVINWCPWINFNCMLAAFLVDNDPVRTAAMKERSLKSMTAYMAYLKPDGGCDEGPSYWGEASGKVYDYVYLMRSVSGEDCGIVSMDRLRAMGEYITDLYVGDGWSVNYADGFARMSSSDVNSMFLYRFGDYVGSSRLKDYSMLSYSETPAGDMFNLFEFNRFADSYKDCKASSGTESDFLSSLGDAWYPDNEVAVLRRGPWTFSAIGHNNYAGPRNDTHNHDDVGSFVLYMDSMPVVVDMGKSTPTNGTYDKERYTFFHIRSNSHNVPDINGVAQGEGADRRASAVYCDTVAGRVRMDISAAYLPEARAVSWRRDFRLTSVGLTLCEKYSLSERIAADTLHFMVRGEVSVPEPGRAFIKVRSFDGGRSDEVLLSYDRKLDLKVETLEMTDPAFGKIWGPELSRLVFVSDSAASLSGSYCFRFNLSDRNRH